jgi:electron transfer flavoprotein alpha subunit
VDVIAAVLRAGGYRSVLFENSVVVADIAAALACRFEAGVVWDLQDVEDRDGALVGRKLVLTDSVAVEATWSSDVRIGVFRLGSFDPIDVGLEARVERVKPTFGPVATAVTVVDVRKAASMDAAVTSADVIVAGGRGLRDQGFLKQLDDLADAMGGVVAVSMPLVDRGWLPHSRQVGQTGNKVRPRLYLACGISGQLGHRVGMEKSGLIVAINTDETAPIFGICDAGLIGDLHEVVPALTQRIRAAHGEPGPQ